MPPPFKAKVEKEQRIATIVGFASQLQKQLESRILDSSTPVQLLQNLSKPFPVPPSSQAGELDSLGRAIWNGSIILAQDSIGTEGFLAHLRVFAFYLLDIAHQAISKQGQSTGDTLIRVLRVALKAGRSCINEFQLDLATRVFERAVIYVETRKREGGSKVENKDENAAIREVTMEELVAEYYLLRATLAWRSERTDLIEYWLSKVSIRGKQSDTIALVEKKADLLYEMGKASLKKKHYDVAAKWLGRSCDAIDTLDREALHPDLHELHFAAMSELIRALTGSKDSESTSKAFNIISLLQMENTEFRMSICVLQLNLLAVQGCVDTEQFFSVIGRIIQSVHIIKGNFDVVMHQIHKLKKANEVGGQPDRQSASLACQALDMLLRRLYDVDEEIQQTCIEKVIVTRIWIVVTGRPTLESTTKLQELLDEILGTTGKLFSSEATHAAQSLMWKLIDPHLGQLQESDPGTWCRLACHAIFQKAGELNKAKLGRKLILNAIAEGDGATAREAYFAMPESGRNAAITNYLMYKLALRNGDVDLASKSLDGVLKATSADETYLYACALVAQQHGDKLQAVAVLQKVLEHFNYSAPKGIYLPALLRSTAKMIISEMDNNAIPKHQALLEVCKVFEGAMSQAKSFSEVERGEPNLKYQAELTWFACYSYNLALNHLSDVHPELLVRFMTVCITFVDLLRSEGNNDKDSTLDCRLLLCRFLAASALIVLGRSEDNVERSLSFYLDARRQIEAFQRCFKGALDLGGLQWDTRMDLVVKDFELLKYDLEALLRLQHWHDLDRVLGLCLAQQHNTRWGTIADLIIHIHARIVDEQLDGHYQAKIPLVMEKIINASWKQEKHDMCKLARWIRCLFQMTLSIGPDMALKCIVNASSIANRTSTAQSFKRYPKDELAWLATSAFNHAVDLYCADDKVLSRSWAENALNLAMAIGQNTGLHAALQAKLLRLQAS